MSGGEREYPLAELSRETLVTHWLMGRTQQNTRPVRGSHSYFAGTTITLGWVYRVNNQDRVVVAFSAYEVVFMVGEKIYSQDVVGFSLAIEAGVFQEAGARSEGMVAFSKILMGLIGAGVSTVSWPLFWAVAVGKTGMALDEIHEDTDLAAIVRFAGAFMTARSILKALAPVIYDKLFNALVWRVAAKLGEAMIDPEAVGKLAVGLFMSYLKGDFKGAGVKHAFKVLLAVGKVFWFVLSRIPKAIELTERGLVHAASEFATALREQQVEVSTAEIWEIATNELTNPKVRTALEDLMTASAALSAPQRQTVGAAPS